MSAHLLAAEATDVGNPVVNVAIFAVFVAVTLVIVLRASRQKQVGRGLLRGRAVVHRAAERRRHRGRFLSAASFLGICGAIAINGFDGFLYSIGFLVAWLVALLLVAELLRNTGSRKMADVLSFRLKQRPVRMAAALATLAVVFFYLLAQMAGAASWRCCSASTPRRAQSVVVAVVGALMILYVLVGGMKGTTWVQIIKAVLLIQGAAVMTVWVLAKFGFNLSDLFQGAIDKAGPGGEALIEPGKQYGATGTTKLDFLSLALALVLGTAGLPHVLMRFYTVPSAKEARRWSCGRSGSSASSTCSPSCSGTGRARSWGRRRSAPHQGA